MQLLHLPLRFYLSKQSQNSEFSRIFRVTGANQIARKLLSTDLVNINKQLLDEVFVIQNNQGRGRSYKPKPITLTETLIILDDTKTESNNCFIIL